MNACEGGNFDVVQILIHKGADINAHRIVRIIHHKFTDR
jgi:hypothetical protein